jgi:parallel beta-helix repeat protein
LRRLDLTLLLALAFTTPVFAADGVLEINQTCASQTGCFAGDTGGFPVTISASAGRSFLLTSDLVLPNPSIDGISITVSDVSIDLNGFEIRGLVSCTGTPLVCTPGTASGVGIQMNPTSNRGGSVRNGSVSGMGLYGVQLGLGSEATNLQLRSNGSGGIVVGTGSIVVGVVASQNLGIGINASSGSTVSGSSAFENGTTGIAAGTGSTTSDNTAFNNGGAGISTSTNSLVTGNTASSNGSDGIAVSSGSTVSSNSISANDGDGIQAGIGSTVQRNTARGNLGFGLNLTTDSTYRENTITANTAGTIAGAGVNKGDNYCAGTGTVSANCP